MLKTGAHSLSLWPFESFDPRMVCRGECHTQLKESTVLDNSLTLNINFDTKTKVKWGLRLEYINEHQHIDTAEGNQSDDYKTLLEDKCKTIKKVKEMLDKYPQENKDAESYEPELLFKHRAYVDVIPAIIKAVSFADPVQVSQCYSFLQTSEQA